MELMSSSSSPNLEPAAHDKTIKKKDRPRALEISPHQTVVRSEHEQGSQPNYTVSQPQSNVLSVQNTTAEPSQGISRSTSASSSLDAYYFGARSPSDSPVPPLPESNGFGQVPDRRPINEPITPAKDPAKIDRRGLVGVGELATPRWARPEHEEEDLSQEQYGSDDGVIVSHADVEQDGPDSPWTIEAVDGESDEKEEVPEVREIPRTIRARPSIADESGGEEILYPRKASIFGASEHSRAEDNRLAAGAVPTVQMSPAEHSTVNSPPSSFATPVRKAKKRTSDEFELDQSGALVSKRLSISSGSSRDKSHEERSSARKHRSLVVGVPANTREKTRDRRRESVGLSLSTSGKFTSGASKSDRHSRQTSASSSSGQSDHHSKRVLTSDFSHLPPSPSTSSIQHFLKHPSGIHSSNTPALRPSSIEHQTNSSPNVAHSLLRGTQEGWSGLDDDATAEALRKLDGLSGKTARARASVGSFRRSSSLSRPATPAKSTSQWEGVGSEGGKVSKRGSAHFGESASVADTEKDKDRSRHQPIGLGLGPVEPVSDVVGSSDEHNHSSSGQDKTPKRLGSAGARTSLSGKRGSASSTNYTGTPTTGSRDSASLSTTTSTTSVSATSFRQSLSKIRRNSAGSDVSSLHSGDPVFLKDRAASLSITGEIVEDSLVPPVPPLPKDLTSFKSPAHPPANLAFPSAISQEDSLARQDEESDLDRTVSLDVPPLLAVPASSPPVQLEGKRHRHLSTYGSGPESAPEIVKTPSKKWSFSSALNLKISTPSSASKESSGKHGFSLSPKASAFAQHLRKSESKDRVAMSAAKMSSEGWSPVQSDAMASAASLQSLSSVGSALTRQSPGITSATQTPDRIIPSRSETGSSASTNQTTSGLAPHHDPLSPSASARRGQSTKRLTPSSIPFFRRSSSQSIQLPPPGSIPASTSPTFSTSSTFTSQPQVRVRPYSPKESSLSSPTTPGTAQKKSSVLSLGLPSLLKGSSSRRSLHGDKMDIKDAKELHRAVRDAEKERERQEKVERERQKKEEKDRSESRISVLMGRRRGKTVSSSDAKKTKMGDDVLDLPPIHMSGIPPATAQRVARLKSTSSSISTPSVPAPAPITRTSSSRATSHTASSLQKVSDGSLRSRNQLPTIAGSPSVGTNSAQTTKEAKELPPSSLMNAVAGNPKETPTKIPRISSRTSSAASPAFKTSASVRRTSVNVNGSVANSNNPSPVQSTNEFGILESGDGQAPKISSSSMVGQRQSMRMSPTGSRVPRHSTIANSISSSAARKSNRDSISFGGLRKASTGSVASINNANITTESHHRFSALSPSKGLKLLSPKVSLHSSPRASNSSSSQSIAQVALPSSSRQSFSTPSPAPSSVDEEELLGDEEMLNYIRRQQSKKLASGATQEELDDLLRFPEPVAPGRPTSPANILKGNQAQHLSGYERKEILDYPSVYCFGAGSEKKPATPEDPNNNYGYDDERGDYLVVNHDHLAYRYEVIDTLGKGSFGQVLHCRDHSTGESVAIKIIRNKKRFHHQALVEIKILDNLRKWDNEEKHHVIKMTEHFYFRNHLCIAMELLSINLYELIKANGFVGFTTTLIRRFTSQMLLSLSLMRHHRIVHCDLKPENVLLKHPAKSAIKVIDFGSSCFEHEKIYTYIQSRFYRSPEVILGMNYHMAIDMWSLGCILAELYTGFPIFPGENEQEQLSCIMEVLGIPDKEFINRSSRKKIFFDNSGAPRPVVNSKGRRRRPGTKTLGQVLRSNDEEFVDFISKCLVWDPERRLKPQQALRHPFITIGRRGKATAPAAQATKTLLSSSTSLSSTSRSKPMETPKKSQISAPTPLAARSSRSTVNVSSTPGTSTHAATLGSSRSYRQSSSHGLSGYHSSRTLTTAAK